MFPRVLNMPLTNGFISGPYTNIWVGKTEAPDVSSWRHIRVVHVAPLNSLEHVPNQTTHCKTTWLAELKPLVFLFLFSVGTWNILKVSDYRNCYEWLLQFEPSTINIYINLKSFGRQQPCLKCNFSLEENRFSEIIGMIETESVQMVHTSTFHSNNAAGLGHCN